MNGSYYQNPTFPAAGNFPDADLNEKTQNQNIAQPTENYITTFEDREINYIEKILQANKGKQLTIFASFPDSNAWKDREFHGIIEGAGKDYVIIKDPSNGEWYLIPMNYVDYFNFNEAINHSNF